jgi:glycosyltransferase involved in cell wall biosynthesis
VASVRISPSAATAPLPRQIVHVVARYPPALGGTEQLAQSLARHQHRLGLNVRVLTSSLRPPGSVPEPEPFPVARLKSAEIAHTPVMPALLPRLLRLDRDSLVHLHISSAYAPDMVWLRSRLRNTDYIAHIHLDVLPSGRAGILLEPYKNLFLRRVLHDAAAVIVPTDDYRPLIGAKYGLSPDRIQVVGCGTDHAIAAEARSGPSAGTRQLLFVGRLSPQKNIPLLLDALADYRRRYSDPVRLTIVGDGALRDQVCAQIARLGLTDVVAMPGPLTGRDLEAAYEQADLLLLTSVNESFGLVLIEAMTKAVPIVSVDIPAVRNVAENGVNGILAASAPEAIADAIHCLLSDRELYATMSKANLEKAPEFGWPAVAAQLTAIYRSLSPPAAKTARPEAAQ